MAIYELPVDWDRISYLADEKIWMIPCSTYQGYEIVVGGSPQSPDPQLLNFAKEIMGEREKWVSRSRDLLWEFIDRSKMPPPEEDWFADAFRFENAKQFIIEFSHVADTYGLWIVELREHRLREGDETYNVHEFRRRNH